MFLGDSESVVSSMGWDIAYTCVVRSEYPEPIYPLLVRVYALMYGRGEDYGVIIRHGYRLTNVEYTDDSTDTFNAVVPYWDDGNGNKTYVTGYVVQPTTPITPVKAVPMDCTQAFQTQPTGAQLAQYAQDWLDNNTPWVNVKNITLDFINGSEISGVNATINLGDTVRIYWPAADINIKLRAIAYDYDILAERYNSIELGKQQENFVSVTGIDGGSGASGGGGVGGSPLKLLWQNTSPTQAFAAQTIPLSDNTCRFFIVFAVHQTNDQTQFAPAFVIPGMPGCLQQIQGKTNGYDGEISALIRRITASTQTSLTFNTCNVIDKNGIAYSNRADLAVPYAVYGID
jgi:hypothetical protein